MKNMTINKIYTFGKNGEYFLDESGLEHIVDGEFVRRPFVDLSGKRMVEDVISGGLHTWGAWIDFLKKHPSVAHLNDFDSGLHKGWYFARLLQNNVITLKIPRELFSGDAASITMMPDTHYKSGYLWKTLFPENYSKQDILDVIKEAFLNIAIEESTKSLIIGYARTMDPFTAIRIRIQLEGNQVRSAFPTWDQPYTGNNGKPYSHEHSISFQMARSTIGSLNDGLNKSRLFLGGEFHFDTLIKVTPTFLLERIPPVYGQTQDKWHKKRKKIIKNKAYSIKKNEISGIQEYLSDFCIAKESFFFQTQLYDNYQEELSKNRTFFNAASIMQNVCDCFYILMCIDNRRGTNIFIDAMQRFLAMAVIHVGGLNTLEYKRVIQLLLDCSKRHHHKDSFKIFLESLSVSPNRIALYTEFNINPFVKTNDDLGWSVIGVTGVKLALTKEHLVEFLSVNLGENYLMIFSKDKRKQIASNIINRIYKESLIRASMLYFKGDDFDFFANEIRNLETISRTKSMPSEGVLDTIVREYCRMLTLARLRVVMDDPDAYKAAKTLWDDYEFGSEDGFKVIQQKHKREFILMMHNHALDSLVEFSKKYNYKKLEKRATFLLSTISKENIPTPKIIPNYIPSWMQDPKYKQNSAEELDLQDI